MQQSTNITLAERLYASLPSDDPRFTELRDYLAAIKTTGQGSPIPRILGEWALLGFLLQTGKIGTGQLPTAMPNLSIPDPATVAQLRQELDDELGDLGFGS